MYNPAHFAEHRPEVLHAFLREHPLGALVTGGGAEELTATHAPMVLDAAAGPHGTLRCHLARANAQWRMLAASPGVLVLFQGVEHYVTPSWYATKREHGRVVPTWNYATVHVWGQARLFEDRDELVRHLREITTEHEAAFAEPWALEDAPGNYIEGLTKAIVGVEIVITRMEGKWKASQNRPVADQQGVVAGLEEIGSARSLGMADVMRQLQGG